ncbi:MAG: ABC transporter permease [Elusimicrobiota bacterium]|jgi:ABC-2 type transport system permease protein|nr:ABC transporter permease [Elusimicrobiota bacterium]
MKIRLRVIKGFFKKEILQTLRDKKMAAVIFAAPILQLTLFGFALSGDVKNIAYDCIYKPSDVLMRKIDKNLEASGYFIKIQRPISYDIFKTIKQKKAEVIIIAPFENLEEALQKGGAQIQLLIDAVNMQRAVQIENYVKNILSKTISEELNMIQPAPIDASIRILYNPSMNNSHFMLPALMGFILCIITVLITGMSLSKEKEFGTFEKLISSPASPEEILLGKILPYIAIAFTAAPMMLAAGVFLFNISVGGAILKIFLSCFVFILSSCSAAVFISSATKTQQQSMMGSLIFLFPALLLSGLIFPVENIPSIVKWTAYINPLYYLVSLLRNIMLKGGDWIFILKNCFALCVIGLFLSIISLKKFNSKLN